MLLSVPPPGRTLLALLGLVCLGVLCSAAGCAAQSLAFGPGTDKAQWSPRALAFSTSVAAGTAASGQFPFIAGGATSSGLIDPYKGQPAITYSNDVWKAADSQGTAWTQVTNKAQWSARSSGGLIDVIVPAVPVQIIVLIGGRNASGNTGLLNDVWSSLDVGVTWRLSNQSVAFTPRENFGLVIAKGYDNANTVYGYLVGGYGLDPNNLGAPAAPLNDVYYSKGRGVNPWVPLPFGNPAPFAGRYGFGIAPYNQGFGLVIAGGVLAKGVAVNEVWALNFNNKKWTSLNPLPSASTGYVGLLLSSQYYYLFCGTDLDNQISRDVFFAKAADSSLKWQLAAANPEYKPARVQFSTIFDTEDDQDSFGLVLAGTSGLKSGGNLQDVTATLLQ